MVQVLMPPHLARFVAVPVSQLLNALGRHDLDLVLAVGIMSALGLGFGLAALLGLAPLAALLLYAGLSCLAFLVTVLAAWRVVRQAALAAA